MRTVSEEIQHLKATSLPLGCLTAGVTPADAEPCHPSLQDQQHGREARGLSSTSADSTT